ncbi:hypothetical protein EC844_10543 [Acinetobacter calcoaceticus]|uniref:Lipoprotein n=1 Tax=Acinetobacter calcoaceticus TaxID=471 RepID=A0A4R1Y053_ACICA|nr:hypothetical protein EC844_10543 [Acinetobacter calcoaceticus]
MKSPSTLKCSLLLLCSAPVILIGCTTVNYDSNPDIIQPTPTSQVENWKNWEREQNRKMAEAAGRDQQRH